MRLPLPESKGSLMIINLLVSSSVMVCSSVELLWFIGQNAYCFVKFSKNFFKTRVRLLHNESSKVLGLTFLHLSSLHHISITARIYIEPTDKQTTTKCLATITSLTNIKQNVRIGRKECFNKKKNRLTKFLIKW